jgi:hypothetical protein
MKLDRDELIRAYVSLVYSKTLNFREAGRVLGIDWRTVKQLADMNLVHQFNAANHPMPHSTLSANEQCGE